MIICLFICTIAFYGFTSLISKTYFSNLVLLGFDPIKKKCLHIVQMTVVIELHLIHCCPRSASCVSNFPSTSCISTAGTETILHALCLITPN